MSHNLILLASGKKQFDLYQTPTIVMKQLLEISGPSRNRKILDAYVAWCEPKDFKDSYSFSDDWEVWNEHIEDLYEFVRNNPDYYWAST